ncbi:hypothetical protein BaRGS_00006984 [Batillaria attramentaria]|uniref:Proton-coupled folate transporter n=1 Tax=Batillaria attramentaria TaxID=370345 RepID=A0ABD0LRV0_9CAEN
MSQNEETAMESTRLQKVLSVCRSVTVEPVLLFFMFASFLTFSAFMAITYDKSCLDLYDSTFCDNLQQDAFAKQHKQQQDAVQTESSHWIMRSNIAMTVPATLSLLLWMGSLGDRVGRRLPLVVPCAGAVVYSICNLINAIYMDASPAFLMIGSSFHAGVFGLSGSYLAVLMGSYTYLTHLADPGKRMMRVGVAEASMYLAGTAVALLYAMFILPDIKPPDDVVESPPRGACCRGVCLNPVRDMWTFVTTAREARTKLYLALLILVLDILQFCTTGEGDISLLYLKRAPRNWSYTTYGYFSGATHCTRGAAVLLLLPLLKRVTSLKDTVLIMAGLVSKMAALIILGLATQDWLIFLVVAVGALQGFPSAGLRASMACLVDKDEQGRMFGIVAATEGIVSFLSTLLFNGLYPVTLDLYDGLCFHLAAALTFVCLVIVLWLHSDLDTGNVPYLRLQEAKSED